MIENNKGTFSLETNIIIDHILVGIKLRVSSSESKERIFTKLLNIEYYSASKAQKNCKDVFVQKPHMKPQTIKIHG